jgi:hypothetical protein
MRRLRRVAKNFAPRRNQREAFKDDYDWERYPHEYAAELKQIEKEFTRLLKEDQYAFDGVHLRSQAPGKPLHPNHRLLYETILQLGPDSVLEGGCGGGDHLVNLSMLLPRAEVFGLDRSAGQLALLRNSAPRLLGRTRVFDMTMPFSDHLPQVELTFTQAVLMHIHTGNGHLVALSNLFRMSSRYLILMENWTRHAFLEDICRLHDEGMTGWSHLHCYFRRSPEFGNKPHLLIASAVPLDLEPLSDYSVMTS